MDLKTFLTTSRHFVANNIGTKPLTSPKIHLVLGTEACDLDSAVSAVVYAYLLSFINYKTSNIENKFLPIINCKRGSLRTKGDIIYAFNKINIEPSLLISIDEIDFQKIKENGKLVVTLVDHNVLAAQNRFLTNDVIEIIDHHKNEMGNAYKNLSRTVIEPVGSCATLIGEEVYQKESTLLSKYKEISYLLYVTILLDTNNLSPQTKKATEKDVSIIKELETVLGNQSRKEVYDGILRARLDVSGLTFADLLVQDLKVISEFGLQIAIPTVLSSLKNVKNLKEQLEDFARQNNYEAVIIMGVLVQDQIVSRDLAIFSTNRRLLQGIDNTFLNAETGALKLEQFQRENNLVIYTQRNSQLSRKFVLPVVRDYLKLRKDEL